MSSKKFTGTGVAIITPFKKGQVDFLALEKIVNHLIKGKVNYLVPLGTTGESATLSESEQREVLDCVLSVNKKRLPIVAGNFGGKNTSAIIEKLNNWNLRGVDAILSASPEYSKPSQEGIYKHYMALAKVSPKPIILYNVPGRTKSNIEWQTTVRLAKASSKFIAIKEASADLVQAAKIIQNKPSRFLVLSGDDETALPFLSLGGNGVLSVIANVYPKSFSTMVNFCLKQEFKKANKLNNQYFELHQWLYVEGNPVGIKNAMNYAGLCEDEVRLPLSRMRNTYSSKLKACMEEIGLKN